MILSNEPGYYTTDGFGIRIENLALVVAPEVAGAEKPMNAFETLTLAPIDRRLIDLGMLSVDEIACIDVIRVTFSHWRIRRGSGKRDFVFVARKGVAGEMGRIFVLDGYLLGRIARRAAKGLNVEIFWFERQVRAI